MQLTETLICLSVLGALTSLAMCYIGREYLRLSAEWGKIKTEWADISKQHESIRLAYQNIEDAWNTVDAERSLLLKISAITSEGEKNAD